MAVTALFRVISLVYPSVQTSNFSYNIEVSYWASFCLSFFISVVTALLSICIFGSLLFGFNEVYIGFPLTLSEHESETIKDRGAATALNFLFASCICFFIVVHPATSTDVDERACVHNEL